MNLHTILFPTDFSELNTEALSYASRLAAESGAKLFIVHVDEQSPLNASMGEAGYLYASQSDGDVRNTIRDQLSRIKPTAPGVTFEHRCVNGAPVKELLQFAKREGVDLIVMGSHGRTGLGRLLMGSVAEGVTRRAECPVLIVKQPSMAVDHVLTCEDLTADQ
jgi:nucleotide-binding universal stress UspA family protein